MAKSDLITQKIDELIDLAKEEGDNNALIIFTSFQGARHADLDHIYAESCQALVRDTILPLVQGRLENKTPPTVN